MNKLLYFFSAVLLVAFTSCNNNTDNIETEKANLTADSLSIKLNSPELKAVNSELIKDPNNAALYHKRAKVYLMLHQLPESSGDALRALKIDSTNSEYYLTLVDSYFAQNKTKMAKDILETIEKKFPDNTEALLKLSELYFLVKQYQNAIDYANKAIKINENLAQAYYLKGNIYRETGDTTKAISSLITTVEQDAKFEHAFQDLAVIYSARKNPIAFDYYNNVLKINPANEDARYGRAKLLQDLGKADEAIKEYMEIVAVNKNCENCYYNMGAIYFELKKDNKKAIELFTKAIAVNPNYIEAYFARGYTYASQKDKINARTDYNMCLQLQPNYSLAIEGLNQL